MRRVRSEDPLLAHDLEAVRLEAIRQLALPFGEDSLAAEAVKVGGGDEYHSLRRSRNCDYLKKNTYVLLYFHADVSGCEE